MVEVEVVRIVAVGVLPFGVAATVVVVPVPGERVEALSVVLSA